MFTYSPYPLRTGQNIRKYYITGNIIIHVGQYHYQCVAIFGEVRFLVVHTLYIKMTAK